MKDTRYVIGLYSTTERYKICHRFVYQMTGNSMDGLDYTVSFKSLLHKIKEP